MSHIHPAQNMEPHRLPLQAPIAPPATLVPTQAPFQPVNTVIHYDPNHNDMYRRRFKAIKTLVHSLEDENNLIALKIAQVQNRLEILRQNGEGRHQSRSLSRPLPPAQPAQPQPQPQIQAHPIPQPIATHPPAAAAVQPPPSHQIPPQAHIHQVQAHQLPPSSHKPIPILPQHPPSHPHQPYPTHQPQSHQSHVHQSHQPHPVHQSLATTHQVHPPSPSTQSHQVPSHQHHHRTHTRTPSGPINPSPLSRAEIEDRPPPLHPYVKKGNNHSPHVSITSMNGLTSAPGGPGNLFGLGAGSEQIPEREPEGENIVTVVPQGSLIRGGAGPRNARRMGIRRATSKTKSKRKGEDIPSSRTVSSPPPEEHIGGDTEMKDGTHLEQPVAHDDDEMMDDY